ncbi:MAG: glycosyltransferase [Leptolyngbya sp. Prado105]|nr:glycosyltransferase [Leptolyngbya sp. Prado105]
MPTPISLITTVYNRDRFLAQTLDSILAQTYPHFELLIWDDGSTDSSISIAQHYATQDSRIRVIQSPQNQGIPHALKTAIDSTSAPYFGWIDSDDLLAPTALEEAVQILDRGLGRLCRIPYSKDRLLVDFMTFHFRLIRRSCYQQVGGIDSSFAVSEDYDLCLKLSEITDIYHLSKPLYYYRRHSQNVTNNSSEIICFTQQAIQNALQRRGLDAHYKLSIQANYSLQPISSKPKNPALQDAEPISLNPLVSIIIPAYNAAPRLALCLQSCLAQTYPNLEILLVDNCSTDETVTIAKTLSESSTRSIQILHCSQQGANAARNLGMSYAQGDYIQWLDADDKLAVDKIEKQIHGLIQHPEADIAYGDWAWCFLNQDRPIAQMQFVDQPYKDMELQALMDNWRPPHAYLIRRRAALRLHHLQAWNLDTTVYMDREYFTIAALLKLRFLYVPQSRVYYYRWSSSQISQTATRYDRTLNRRRIFRRFRDIASLMREFSPTRSQQLTQFLLEQSWELWQPAFQLVQTGTYTFVLERPQHSDHFSLSWQEANMIWALLQSPYPRTLEDHSRKIIQILWREILMTFNLSSALDSDTLLKKLAQQVSDRRHSDFFPDWIIVSNPRSNELCDLHPLLQEVPLFTPFLVEERLRVLQFLDRLRQAGWLEHSETIYTSITKLSCQTSNSL